MNRSSSNIDGALLAAPYQLNIWFGTFLWIAGNIGCMGNMIVFRSRAFRDRAYSIYLFSEAMSDFLYFNFLLLTRILQKGYQIPITTRYVIFCKLRQFQSFWGNQVSFTLFTFATTDRLLSTQRDNRYRQWSNRVSLAYKLSVATVLFWFFITGHRLILYSIVDDSCSPQAGFYTYFDNYLEVIFSGICPPILTSVLAYLLIGSVRDVLHRRIVPENRLFEITIVRRTILQQMDTQLTLMLILQSIIVIITYIPYATELIYSNVTEYWLKSALRYAREKVFTELSHLVSYVFFASSFYVSMISNDGFRRQMKSFLQARIGKHRTGIAQNGLHINAITNTQRI